MNVCKFKKNHATIGGITMTMLISACCVAQVLGEHREVARGTTGTCRRIPHLQDLVCNLTRPACFICVCVCVFVHFVR